MRRTIRRPQWVCALTAACLMGTAAVAAPGDPDEDGPPAPQKTDIAGRIESFNLNTQRGELDGLILFANGTRVQLNLPESIADEVAKAVAVGDIPREEPDGFPSPPPQWEEDAPLPPGPFGPGMAAPPPPEEPDEDDDAF